MERPIILVTGANGQLGSELRDLSKEYKDWDWLFTDHQELDITDTDALNTYFLEQAPLFVLNTAAYTAVDQAEDEGEMAYKVNSIGVKNLVEVCTKLKAKLIQVSTDFVFDGNSSVPYLEGDKTFPLGVYGASKLEGEQEALKYDEARVIRTSWVYSKYGKNFVKTMLRLGKEKDSLNVVVDQIGSPTWAADLARAICEMVLEWDKLGDQRLFHYSNSGYTSWYHFAREIMEKSDLNCKVNPIPSSMYPTKANRPKYSVLDKTRIVKALDLSIPEWQDSLAKCLEQLNNEN